MTAISSTAVEFPRRYLPVDLVLGTWEAAEPFYRELAARPISSDAELERWLVDFSELDAAFEEAGTSRYIAMTCQTDDPQREQAYLQFVEEVKPKREPIAHELRKKYVELAKRFPLPVKRYEVLDRAARNAIEIYRDENVPLMTEDDVLRQSYQKIVAAMTVNYRGQEMTLQQLGRFLEEPDRAVREETWRLGSARFVADGPALDELYGKMIAVRDRIARNAACCDYREYAFKAMERFDYTADDCLRFHDAIEAVVVPAVGRILERRRQQLKLDRLRPWDLAVDPENRPPLRPFEKVDQLATGCSRVFHRVDGDLGKIFDTLRGQNLLDLDSRKGKAPGGYQAMYHERRLPFIFMNAVGTEGDVRTLLHEGGHAFHSWACRNDPLLAYRNYPTEFAEVASMGMECLALPFLEEFYQQDVKRAKRRFFEEIVMFYPWMARVDAFQHYAYTHVAHTPEQRNDEWVRIRERFSTIVDWSGLEAYDRRSWHRKLHFFEVPFYYVEYGIAQLGALQVWLNGKRDFREAVAMYRNGLALGGARPLPELFAAAGCRWDFSEKTLRPLIDAVMEEIEKY